MTDDNKILNQIMDKERCFRRQITMAVGLSSIVERSSKRLSAYHDLLEDEWEGRHSALDFLRKGQSLLAMLRNWNKSFLGKVTLPNEFELLALRPIVEGMADVARHKTRQDIQLSDMSNIMVQGDAFLLQEILFEMTERVSSSAAADCETVTVITERTGLSSTDLGVLRSELPTGEYVLVYVTSGGGDLTLSDFASMTELADSAESPAPDLDCLHWLGAAILHSGDLFLRRDRGMGAMLLALPVSESDTAQDLRARSSNGHNETILLVDDEDMIWDVVFSMLQDLGYTVLLAENGKDAVDIFRSNPQQVDLVLLDMLMPVMNAREAFHLLKQTDPDVKVLLASGYVEEEDVQDVLSAGALGFLRKPYRLRDLARKIREILDRKNTN